MNTLVVYYSRTGTTKKVGEALTALLDCDSEELIDTKKRTGLLGFLKSGRDAAKKELTVLESLVHDPQLYDVVVLGTPVWGGTMSSPTRTYIETNKSKFNRVAFFCTQGGSDNPRLFSDMAALCVVNQSAFSPCEAQTEKRGLSGQAARVCQFFRRKAVSYVRTSGIATHADIEHSLLY